MDLSIFGWGWLFLQPPIMMVVCGNDGLHKMKGLVDSVGDSGK